MSGFIANNSEYNINTDHSMSVILSHFDPELILRTVKGWIDIKYEEPMPLISNIIMGYNENFKQLLHTYQNQLDQEQTMNTRNMIYKDIINLICNEYNLEFNITDYDEIDLYTPAFYLFRLLVSEFTENVKTFFTNFILKEKNNLYESLNMNQFKKDKDASTVYNKKRMDNNKLAIIISRLGYVIDNICVYDISFEDFLRNVYSDENLIQYLLRIVAPRSDFFKQYVATMFGDMSKVRASLISGITIMLYKAAGNDIFINDLMEDEE